MGEGESPRNPFSISVILSDEVGQKRSPPSTSVTPSSSATSVTPLSRNEHQRRSSQEATAERSGHQFFHTPSRPVPPGSDGWGGGGGKVRASWLSLSEAGNLMKTPLTSSGPSDGEYTYPVHVASCALFTLLVF